MKSKEEIEQLAFLKYPRRINDPYNPMEDDNSYERKIWIDGYTQCQEDMTNKKYTEEDMLQCWNACLDFNKPAGLDSGINYKDYINSLNKQD